MNGAARLGTRALVVGVVGLWALACATPPKPQELEAFGITRRRSRKSAYATPFAIRTLRSIPAVRAENQPP